MIYLITYDKGRLLGNYSGLEEAIKFCAPQSWWHHMNNTWLIKTQMSATDIYNRLCPHITTDDKLMIVEVKQNYQGWLTQEAWNWIGQQFDLETPPNFTGNPSFLY